MKSNRQIQYLAAFAVSLANLCNGVTFFWITSTLPKFMNKEILANITTAEISWVVSIKILGLILGSLATSSISDNFGRRTTLTTSAVPHIIGTVFVLCATNTWMLYIGRILWGCTIGMTTTVSSMYLSEIADKEIRGTLTVLTRIFFSVGVMLVLTIGSYVSYQVLNGIMIVFPALYFLACLWIPESPYYLLKEGKVAAAKKALLRLGGHKDEKVIDEKLSLMRSDVRKEMARSGSLKELFTGKQYRRAIIASTGLRGLTLLTGIIPIQEYFGSIIQQSNCGINVSTALAIFGGIRLVVEVGYRITSTICPVVSTNEDRGECHRAVRARHTPAQAPVAAENDSIGTNDAVRDRQPSTSDQDAVRGRTRKQDGRMLSPSQFSFRRSRDVTSATQLIHNKLHTERQTEGTIGRNGAATFSLLVLPSKRQHCYQSALISSHQWS